MTKKTRTEEGEAVTNLILDVFRLNGHLLVSGDRLVAELGLTSARWQVLGSIAYSEEAETVSWHARSMGHHRQAVQRIVNELEAEGIVEFQTNPKHKRASLVDLTSKGRALYDAAIAKQIPWVNAISDGLKLSDLIIAKAVIDHLKDRLEQHEADI